MNRVVVTRQVREAGVRQRPRGNLSDLYPRWLGARELLLHGRDPYSPEVTREIQAGYYGRPLDSARSSDPKDKAAFAYPIYVAFLLAPTVHGDFAFIQRCFFWLLVAITAGAVLLWLRLLNWHLPPLMKLGVVALSLSSIGGMQGLMLQQLSLLVAGLIALAVALLVSDHQVAAGFVLAIATIKPQLVLLLLIWLAIWTVADWRHRYRWAASFALSMVALVTVSSIYSPRWIPHFLSALKDYQNYTGATSVLDNLIGTPWSWILEVAAFAAVMAVCWRSRSSPASGVEFAAVSCAVLAVTVLLVPTSAQYNQVLLIPAVLVLAGGRTEFQAYSFPNRLSFTVVAMLIGWQWVAAAILGGLTYLIAEEKFDWAWATPLWMTLQLPVAIVALALLHRYQSTIGVPTRASSS